MALSNLNPAPACLGSASGATSGSVLQGGALAPITTTQKTATSAPGFYMNYLNNLATQAQAGGASATPIGPQALQTQAFNQASQNAGNYQPALSAATGTAAGVAGSCLAQMAQGYMNPYTKCVVNAIGNLGQANINQNLAPQTTAGIVGSGQFGSQRGAGALGQVLANADLAITGQQACALKSGYTQGICTAKAQTANQLNAGKLLGCLANVQSSLGINCAKNLAALGQCQYTIAQNQSLFPLSVAKAESCVLKGFTMPTAISCIKTAPIPGAYAQSPLAQVAGLGSLAKGILGCKGISSLGSLFGGSAAAPNIPKGSILNPAGNYTAPDGSQYSPTGQWISGSNTSGVEATPTPDTGAAATTAQNYYGNNSSYCPNAGWSC